MLMRMEYKWILCREFAYFSLFFIRRPSEGMAIWRESPHSKLGVVSLGIHWNYNRRYFGVSIPHPNLKVWECRHFALTHGHTLTLLTRNFSRYNISQFNQCKPLKILKIIIKLLILLFCVIKFIIEPFNIFY